MSQILDGQLDDVWCGTAPSSLIGVCAYRKARQTGAAIGCRAGDPQWPNGNVPFGSSRSLAIIRQALSVDAFYGGYTDLRSYAQDVEEIPTVSTPEDLIRSAGDSKSRLMEGGMEPEVGFTTLWAAICLCEERRDYSTLRGLVLYEGNKLAEELDVCELREFVKLLVRSIQAWRFEERNGEGSLLDRNHPVNIKFAQIDARNKKL